LSKNTNEPDSGQPESSWRSQWFRLFIVFRASWRQLLSIHIAVNALILIILGPLASGLLRLALSFSGNAALSDQDILFYVLTPGGLIAMLGVASVFSIIVFLEHAALVTVILQAQEDEPPGVTAVLKYLIGKSKMLFSLAARVLVRVLLIMAPFGLLLLLVYKFLLGEHDINFYLAEKPPEFLWAVVWGGLIGVSCGAILMRQFISWVFCLPLLLTRELTPAQSIQQSVAATRGHRLRIGAWLTGWLIFSVLMAAIVTGLTGMAGNFLVPSAVDSFQRLLLTLSLLLMLVTLLNFGLTWLNSSFLSIIIVSLYRGAGLAPAGSSPVNQGSNQRLEKLLKPGWLAALLVASAVIATFVVNGILDRVPLEDHTQVMAHRGASSVAPENTLAAIQAAIDAGANWVEIDVQETADGEIVVIHDSDLKKISGQPVKVADSTLAELQQFDIGSWFDPRFEEQRIPTLARVMDLCKNRIGVNIELKYYGGEKRLEESVAEIVESAGMEQQVVFMSLDYGGIQRMRKLRPGWKMGLLSSVSLGNLGRLDLDFLALNARSASRSRIRHIQESGKQIMTWTVNDAIGMSSMFNRGVDFIITDKPALAVSVLEQRADLEPTQRLLIQLADLFDQPVVYAEQ